MICALELSNAGHLAVAALFTRRDRFRPELGGVFVTPAPDRIGVRIVATDGCRMSVGLDRAARCWGTWPRDHGTMPGVLVPRAALEATKRRLQPRTLVVIQVEEAGTIVLRPGEGGPVHAPRCSFPYPDVTQLLPTGPVRPAVFAGFSVDVRFLADLARIKPLLFGCSDRSAGLGFWRYDANDDAPPRALLVTLDEIDCWNGLLATRRAGSGKLPEASDERAA